MMLQIHGAATADSPIGEITKKIHVVKEQVEWDIPDFRRLLHPFHLSPPFRSLENEYCLQIVPNWKDQWISLFLLPKSIKVSRLLTFTLAVKHREIEIFLATSTHLFSRNGWGFDKFCSRKDFLEYYKNPSEIPFTVCCYLEYCNTEQSIAAFQTSLCGSVALSTDLQGLLESGRQSDVTIEVMGHKFKAHKSILVARSPVFAAMFGHDMSEKREGVVRIDDCEPNAFYNFLQCLYTGTIKNLSMDNAINLYMTADKYNVTDIIKASVLFMIEGVREDKACDFLLLADKYNETKLKNSVEKYLIKNMKTILPTSNWKTFMSEHPLMAQEILIKSFSREFPNK